MLPIAILKLVIPGLFQCTVGTNGPGLGQNLRTSGYHRPPVCPSEDGTSLTPVYPLGILVNWYLFYAVYLPQPTVHVQLTYAYISLGERNFGHSIGDCAVVRMFRACSGAGLQTQGEIPSNNPGPCNHQRVPDLSDLQPTPMDWHAL